MSIGRGINVAKNADNAIYIIRMSIDCGINFVKKCGQRNNVHMFIDCGITSGSRKYGQKNILSRHDADVMCTWAKNRSKIILFYK